MQSRSASGSKIAIDMTPMIDVVFQLLIFFILTLQIAVPEGDFQVRMPIANNSPGQPHVNSLPPVCLQLLADERGNLKQINFLGKSCRDWTEVTALVESLIDGDGDLAAVMDVEIASDYDLAYEHTIAAVTAVSGRVDEQGKVVKLIERIRFAP